MSNKAVLPAGKDTIGVRYIEDEGTNIETVIRSTNYVAGTSGYNFALNGSAGTATLDAKDNVTVSSNYSVGVSGARIFMDGSAGDISLIATNDVLLDAAYVAGVSGAKLFLDRSLNRIEGSCGDFIASAFNDIYLSSNYSAGVSGAQLFIDGSAGTATLDAKGNISLSSNFSTGVSGSRININANGDIAQECALSFYMTPQADFNVQAGNDATISANYSAGVSGCQLFFDGSAGNAGILAINNSFLASNDTYIDANYSAGVSGARIFMDGSLGNTTISNGGSDRWIFYSGGTFAPTANATQAIGGSALAMSTVYTRQVFSDTGQSLALSADNNVTIDANYSAGVSGARIFMDGSGGAVQILGDGAANVFLNKPMIYLGNANPGQIDQLKLAHNNDVVIDANYSAGVSGGRIFMDGSTGVTEFVSQGNVAVRISSTATYQNFSIHNATTAAAANVHIVAGSAQMYRSTSAAKYKTDIQPLSEEALEANLNIQGVFYRSLCEHDCKEKIHVGIVADQAEPYSPWLMHYGANSEIEGFQYERQIAFNLEHIKRLSAKLEDALERINELEEILYGEPDLDTL